MTEIKLGTKLQSVKKGTVGTVADINAKYRTAFLELDDGTTMSYSLATLKDKRYWQIIDETDNHLVPMPGIEKLEELKKEVSAPETTEDQYVEEVMEQKAELGIECPEIKSVEIVDETLRSKFTKKEQRIITTIYKDNDNLYHVVAERDDQRYEFVNRNLMKIAYKVRDVVRGVYYGETC